MGGYIINFVIVGILAVALLLGIRSTVKHFKGQGGCCGGESDYKPKKKKLKAVTATKTFKVEGMHCEHCRNRVTEAVNDIPHVAGVVNLKKVEVTVSYEEPVPDDVIKEKIERAGYKVTEVIG